MKANKKAPKDRTKKIILTSVSVGAAGILGYFGWQYFKAKKQGGRSSLTNLLKTTTPSTAAPFLVEEQPALPATPVPPLPKHPATPARKTTPAPTGLFPLKKGSTGDKVKLLQQALISRYGASLLPRYGADSEFGTETVNALKKVGLPEQVDESTFLVLTQGMEPDGHTIGVALYNATMARDFARVMAVLKKIKTKQDYGRANEVFKTYRTWGVRQTIVNALLTTFSGAKEQEQIKFEFLRMGLQFDGRQWSLSGTGGLAVMTAMPTVVWVNRKRRVQVPPRMVLGNQVSERSGFTLFENRGRYFLVPTRAIQYLSTYS